MKKILNIALVLLSVLYVSCNKMNELDSRLSDVEGKVRDLEERVNGINESIAALQASVKALEGRDYIKSIIKKTDSSGKVVSVTLAFAYSGNITITSGEDGKTPAVGVAEYQGLYFWTVNGEWMLDAQGRKIPVTGEKGEKGDSGERGEKGEAGTVPVLKIESDYWYVSYDKGENWIKLGIATTSGGDSIFSAVYEDGGELVLVLRDGNTFRVPVGVYLSIDFDIDDSVPATVGETLRIHYTVKSSDSAVTVEAVSSSDIRAKVIPDNPSGLTGCIELMALSEPDEEYSKAVVLCSSQTRVVMRTLRFEKGCIEVVSDSVVAVDEKGGSVSLDFITNLPFDVVVPQQAQSWISYNPSKAPAPHRVCLDIAPYSGQFSRSAEVSIASRISSLSLTYLIVQRPSSAKKFSIHHICEEFSAPSLSGTGISAVLDWGDRSGYVKWYPGIGKQYNDGAKSHTVVIEAVNLEKIQLNDLKGIMTIDLSDLYK